MLSFDDERWNNLTGGYKTAFDPRSSLRKLESHNQSHSITNVELEHPTGPIKVVQMIQFDQQ